jgi:heat shock protein HtpX
VFNLAAVRALPGAKRGRFSEPRRLDGALAVIFSVVCSRVNCSTNHRLGTLAMNGIKVFVLMAGLTALFVAVGAALGGTSGMVIAFLIAAAINLFAYFNSANAALRMFGARIVSAQEAPELYEQVDRLRQRAGLPMPQLAIAPQPQPNAFATGRNASHAVVCVTEGLLRLVDRAELEGVLAHELAHIKNGDMLLQTLSATLAGAVGMMSRFGMVSSHAGGERRAMNPLLMILAPLAAMLIQFAISRQREYRADATGAQLSGRPLDLAAALKKISAAAKQIPMRIAPTYAPMAQVDPLQAVGGGMRSLFSTHPPIEERVARLEQLAREAALRG